MAPFDTINFFTTFDSNRHVADAASIRNPDASSVAYVPTAAKEDASIFDTFNFFATFDSNRHVADAASIRNPDASSVGYVQTPPKKVPASLPPSTSLPSSTPSSRQGGSAPSKTLR